MRHFFLSDLVIDFGRNIPYFVERVSEISPVATFSVRAYFLRKKRAVNFTWGVSIIVKADERTE